LPSNDVVGKLISFHSITAGVFNLSYQVIARKYRPQTFADLTGQEHISRTLSHALDNQRLHHAYLFSGVRGTGKTTTARIFAKGLNCHTGVTSQPCLRCPSCLEIALGDSPGVREIDAASNTGVDNVRQVIIDGIATKTRDRYKIFVIDEVHMLSNSAFNALLKTLEEPPPFVVFIMATTELHKVPDTILSRCQQFEFRQIPAEKIYQRLRVIAEQEAIKIGEAALRELARAGAGSLRDAQSAFDQVIAFSGTEVTEDDVISALGLVSARTLGEFAAAIAGQNVAQLLSLIEEISSRGYDLRNFTRELMAYWRHILVVKSGISDSEVLGIADVEVTKLRELTKQFSEEDLVRGFHFLAEVEKEIKDSPHPRFQLEIGLVKLAQATRLRSLAELIERLEKLETSVMSGGGGMGRIANRSESMQRGVKNVPQSTQNKSAALPPSNSLSAENISTTKSSVAKASMAEPPDFPNFDPFDELPPDDLAVSDFAAGNPPRSSKPPAVKSNPAKPAAGPVTPGQELQVIVAELNRLNRTLLAMAFEDAQVSYAAGLLTFVFASEDVIAKKVRESTPLFRELGERLFGQPLRIEVKISGDKVKVVNEAEQARAELHERARQNPAVRLLLDKFKAEIVSVRPAKPDEMG
jgi:DNA polymerase III subunit gamma/tau